MSETLDTFRAAYDFAFRRYLADPGEGPLRAAYELGRQAIHDELSVLDLAGVHHDVLLASLRRATTTEAVSGVTGAAQAFFVESLATFEMVRRGFRETQETTRAERRHAAMLRQLSTFLADASLAVDAAASTEEILRLVAEQARDLLDADRCVARVGAAGTATPTVAVAEGGDGEAAAGAWDERPWTFTVVGGIDARAAADDGVDQASAPDAPERRTDRPRTVLATPLVALDGRPFGAIELSRADDRPFTDLDEAVLVHLAQMAAAALERARLYRGGA